MQFDLEKIKCGLDAQPTMALQDLTISLS